MELDELKKEFEELYKYHNLLIAKVVFTLILQLVSVTLLIFSESAEFLTLFILASLVASLITRRYMKELDIVSIELNRLGEEYENKDGKA